MKHLRTINVAMILMLVFALLPMGQAVAAPARSNGAGDLYVPGELVVGFDSSVAVQAVPAAAAALAGKVSAQVVSTQGQSVLLRADSQANVATLIKQVKSMSGVKYAEPNYYYRAPQTVNVAKAGTFQTQTVTSLTKNGKVQYNLDAKRAMVSIRSGRRTATYPVDNAGFDNWGWWNVNAPVVWNDPVVARTVCVIDSGVDYKHKDLAGKVIKGIDLVNGDTDPMDDFGHGTMVAGVIAAVANNKEGIAGVSNGKILAVKALDGQGKGTSWEIANAIAYCADQPASAKVDVINLSLGGPGYSQMMELAIMEAKQMGKLVVAAAGNDGVTSYCDTQDVRFYPAGFATEGPIVDPSTCTPYTNPDGSIMTHAGYDNVLSVGAIDSDSQRADFSNYGSWVGWAMPGVDITTTTPWDKPFAMNFTDEIPMRYGQGSGTSLAAPFLSGVAARAWSTVVAADNTAKYPEVLDELKNTAYEGQGGEDNWPVEQGAYYEANLAGAMGKGAISAQAFDAITGTPLLGATVSAFAYNGDITGKDTVAKAALKEVGVVTSSGIISSADIINVPENDYQLKINMPGYTAGLQPAFVTDYTPDVDEAGGWVLVSSGEWNTSAYAAVPPKGNNFVAVTAWSSYADFDLATYAPETPATDFYAAGRYVVSGKYGPGDDLGSIFETGPLGDLNMYPGARASFVDNSLLPWEAHTIRATGKSTYVPGTYNFRLTDMNAGGDLLADSAESFFLWKGGVLVGVPNAAGFNRVDRSCTEATWWNILSMTSTKTGETFMKDNTCGVPVQ